MDRQAYENIPKPMVAAAPLRDRLNIFWTAGCAAVFDIDNLAITCSSFSSRTAFICILTLCVHHRYQHLDLHVSHLVYFSSWLYLSPPGEENGQLSEVYITRCGGIPCIAVNSEVPFSCNCYCLFSGSSTHSLAAWKRPVVVNWPLGIVSGIELTFCVMFLVLLIWFYTMYLVVNFSNLHHSHSEDTGEMLQL